MAHEIIMYELLYLVYKKLYVETIFQFDDVKA